MIEERRSQVHNIGGTRAWVIWAVAVAVYALAVFHRTSLGVAGIAAAERFHISAGQLSTFTVLQLAVYAGMQIPVGVLLDRFGSKRLIGVGLILLTLGQFWFAFATSFGAGLAARVLLGIGDAMIFTSLLRLVALWFRVKQAPIVTQITAMVGQLGAVAAATPLSWALARYGWTRSYASAASIGVFLAVGVVVLIKDSPYRGGNVERIKVRALAHSLSDVWDNPGTRLGIWAHFTSQFGALTFVMLWGYPFLVSGEGVSSTLASSMLILMTLTGMVGGPIIGWLTASIPYRRVQVVQAIVAAIILVWAVTLLWPGPAPIWLLFTLVVVTALGAPGAIVSFDVARSWHRSSHLGRATGVINIGGFVASLATIGLIGVILDWRAPGGPSTYTLLDFRIAMAVQFPFWIIGSIQLMRYRRKGLAHLEQRPGGIDALRRGDVVYPDDPDDLDDPDASGRP